MTFLISVPSGVPNIISLSSSSTSIHLKWRPPVFINAELVAYKLTLTPVDTPSQSRVKVIINVSLQKLFLKLSLFISFSRWLLFAVHVLIHLSWLYVTVCVLCGSSEFFV